jgi:PEP-CTERM motif-containing protein
MTTNGLRSGVFLPREVTMKPVAARLLGIFVLAAIVIGVASAPASAEVVRWHLPGVIDGSSFCSEDFPDPSCEAYRDLLLQSFPVGTHVDFDLTIDTHDFCSEPDLGLYSIREFNVTINGATGTSVPEDAGVVEVPNNLGCFHLGVSEMYVVGFLNKGAFLDLFNTVEMFFGVGPGDDLPTTLVSGGFFLERFRTERALGGPVGPLSVVPEPTTAVLVLSGLVAAVVRRRRLVGRHRR